MIVFDDKRQTATASTMTDLIIKIKLYHKNFSEILDGISEYSSKWILVSRILSENTKGNYTEKYVSLLKLKNHVNVFFLNTYIFQYYIRGPGPLYVFNGNV